MPYKQVRQQHLGSCNYYFMIKDDVQTFLIGKKLNYKLTGHTENNEINN